MAEQTKRQGFAIYGPKTHLDLFLKDILAIGYTYADPDDNDLNAKDESPNKHDYKLSYNLLRPLSFEKFKEVTFVQYNLSITEDVRFDLPNQWGEALSFLKAQYDSSEKAFDNAQIKAGDWVYSLNHSSERERTTGSIVKVKYNGDGRLEYIMVGDPNDYRVGSPSDFRKATKEEILSHLQKEAKRLGFTSGKAINMFRNVERDEMGVLPHGVYGMDADLRIGGNWYYKPQSDTLYTYGWGVGVVYEKGQWATLKTSLPKINGYEGNFDEQSGLIHYGCARINPNINKVTNAISEFNGELKGNRTINSVVLSSGVTIDMADLIQLVVEK